MANTSSAKKMTRKIATRTMRNKSIKTRCKTAMKKVLNAIASGDKTTSQIEFRLTQKVLHSACSKGILHLNNASRKIKKLSAKIKAMPGEFIVGDIKA